MTETKEKEEVQAKGRHRTSHRALEKELPHAAEIPYGRKRAKDQRNARRIGLEPQKINGETG